VLGQVMPDPGPIEINDLSRIMGIHFALNS